MLASHTKKCFCEKKSLSVFVRCYNVEYFLIFLTMLITRCVLNDMHDLTSLTSLLRTDNILSM